MLRNTGAPGPPLAGMVLWGASWILGGCGGAPPEPPGLLECERLAFVPRGASTPLADVRCACPEDLLVDRFEVTRALWLAVARRTALVADLDGRLGQDWSQGSPQLPAVAMDYGEAQRFAALRDMRLPTVGEWMYVAGGSRAQYWPQGNSRPTSVANTAELDLARAAAAGTFPGGVTSGTGVHDMIGNVWEWVAPPLPPRVQPDTWFPASDSPHPLWAMGGSYLYPARELYGFDSRRHFNALGLEPAHRAVDLGLRCVVPAEPYLRTHGGEWSEAAHRGRVVAVGRLWGPRSAALLERLVAEPGAAPALGWLLEGARQ